MHIGDGQFRFNPRRPIRVATGVCGLCLSCSAAAAPSFSWVGSSPSAIASARTAALLNLPVVRHEYTPTMNLDLRASAVSASAIRYQGAVAPASAPFASTTRYLDLGKSDLAADNRIQTRALGIGELKFRMMSQAETFTRRVRQEGLPIARLFESKSALLSIGLNKRGKPGLWFTQKTH
jgi:hypothetical protein